MMKRTATKLMHRLSVCTGTAAPLLVISCSKSGHVQDEARRASRSAASFPAADEDYFHDMDGALKLTSDEVKERNMWLVWTGGDNLWPEKRDQDQFLCNEAHGKILQTTATSDLTVHGGYLPDGLKPLLSPTHRLFPGFAGEGEYVKTF